MKGQLRIEQMYAFVVLDPADNTEGLPAFIDPATGMPMPMVGADMKMVEKLRPAAERMAEELGVTVTLCRFEVRTELEVIKP